MVMTHSVSECHGTSMVLWVSTQTKPLTALILGRARGAQCNPPPHKMIPGEDGNGEGNSTGGRGWGVHWGVNGRGLCAGRSEKEVTFENFYLNLMNEDNSREGAPVQRLAQSWYQCYFYCWLCVLSESMCSGDSCLNSGPGSAISQLGGLGHLVSPPWISVCTFMKC